MKKIISLIMVLAMMCLAFASCGEIGTTGGTDGTTAGDQPSNTVATLDPNLPVEDGYGLNGETPTDLSIFKTQVLKDGTVKIKGVYAEAAELKKIVVPAVIDGKKVSTIGESAFAKLTALEELVVSGYVTSIEPYAISDCAALKTIKLPQYITTIGEGAFSGCKALENTNFLPTSLQSLGMKAFQDCGLKEASLPDSLTTIGGYTFVGCAYLTTVKLPAGITAIPEKMFMGCQKVKNTVGSENFVIPAGVKTIGDLAFYECQTVGMFELPEGLEKIGKQAFDTCRRLETLVIPNSVKSIGEKCFNTCQKLKTVTMPSGADVKIGATLFTDAKRIEIFNVTAGSAAETYCNEWLTTITGINTDAGKTVYTVFVVNVG